MKQDIPNQGPLSGIRVFDMTRILAGPSATQILGDMGADVIKVERPGQGDDTRKWGPPYLKDKDGNNTSESAYYLSANRNKKSLALDFTTPEGLAIAKKLIASCDILVENYKAGSLEKYGLSYAHLKEEFPKLIYCSITGFGHDGPYKNLAGYDFLIQGMGGIMSLTGPAAGEPYKIGVAQTDLITGLYALNGILAALYHRERSGEGQFIDVALLDCQVAALSNAGQYYLTSGNVTPRMGNAHPTIVPYEAFPAKDGHIILAIGNDKQFRDFCLFAGRAELADDPRFAQNQNRVIHREIIVPIVRDIIAAHTQKYWIENLEKRGVPCGPVNTLDQVFADPQVQARGTVIEMDHPLSPEPTKLIANPLKFSATPVTYRTSPPILGDDTEKLLNAAGLTPEEINKLKEKSVI